MTANPDRAVPCSAAEVARSAVAHALQSGKLVRQAAMEDLFTREWQKVCDRIAEIPVSPGGKPA